MPEFLKIKAKYTKFKLKFIKLKNEKILAMEECVEDFFLTLGIALILITVGELFFRLFLKDCLGYKDEEIIFTDYEGNIVFGFFLCSLYLIVYITRRTT